MNHHSLFQPIATFAEDFLLMATHAKQRIWVQVMFFDSGEITRPFEKVLIDGAKRGLDVRLHVDWVTNKYFGGELLILPPLRKKDRELQTQINQNRQDMFDRLTLAGVKIVLTNIPPFHASTFPMIGRNHTKIFVVDEACVWLGGVNIAEVMYTNEDFMVKFFHPTIVQAVSEQFLRINNNTAKDDYQVACDSTHTLIVDSGKRGKSLILDEAYLAVSSATKEIMFVSQLVPDGKLLSLLSKKAKQGVRVSVVTSSSTDLMVSKFPYSLTFRLFRQATDHIPAVNLYHYPTKMHSKLILIDNSVALFGSHNFVSVGVLFGTQEICMKTTESELVAELTTYSRTLVKKSTPAS